MNKEREIMGKNTEERVNPIRITDHDTEKTYELDFSRESVRFAEARGFEPEHISRFPSTKVPELFYYAFRKNHKNMSRSQTDDLLNKIGGLTGEMLARLIDLFRQAGLAHVIALDEDMEKNSKVTVEM